MARSSCASNAEHHCLAIYPGGERKLHHLGLEVMDSDALEAARHALAQRGFQPLERGYDEPGHGEALCYLDADGNRIELYEGMTSLDQPLQPREIRPLRFGHITLQSIELKRAAAFYTDVLGFRVSDTAEDAVIWLRCNQEHHGIALLNARSRQGEPLCLRPGRLERCKAHVRSPLAQRRAHHLRAKPPRPRP